MGVKKRDDLAELLPWNFWLTSVPFYLIPRILEKDFIFPDKYY